MLTTAGLTIPQYKSLVDRFDFDMIAEVLPQSLSSYELLATFISDQVDNRCKKLLRC